MVHTAIKDMQCFDKAADAPKTAEFLTQPYVVKFGPEIASLMDQTSIKASVGIFRVQFPSSHMAKTSKRGQMPFTHD